MPINKEYTAADHAARDSDVYALAKYNWTLRKMRRLGLNSGCRVANIGCGAGTFTEMLAKEGYQVYATEPDLAAYAQAKEVLPRDCVIAPIGLFEVEDQFDVIVMHDVLEHIDAEGAAVDKLCELLRPGGFLIVTVPALDQLFGHHDVQLGHFRRYTRASVTRALSRRFVVCRVRYYGFTSIPITFILSRVLRKDYPDLSGDKRSFAHRIYGAVCAIEGRVPTPLGTAVMAIAQVK